MSDGYTYTTISARPGEPMKIGVSFYLDQRASISVPGIGAGQPHLHLSHGDVWLTIAPRHPDGVTAEDDRIARFLADQAAMYAAEIERLCAGNDAGGPGTAAA